MGKQNPAREKHAVQARNVLDLHFEISLVDRRLTAVGRSISEAEATYHQTEIDLNSALIQYSKYINPTLCDNVVTKLPPELRGMVYEMVDDVDRCLVVHYARTPDPSAPAFSLYTKYTVLDLGFSTRRLWVKKPRRNCCTTSIVYEASRWQTTRCWKASSPLRAGAPLFRTIPFAQLPSRSDGCPSLPSFGKRRFTSTFPLSAASLRPRSKSQ
jgi:hypothetical protein